MNKYKVILLYVALLLAVGCGSSRSTSEGLVETKTEGYALPGSSEISLRVLCDNLERIRYKNVAGPVTTQVVYRDKEPVLVTQYDTIYKEKTVYRDRWKEKVVTRSRVLWWPVFAALGVIALFCFFPAIPKGINVLVRRFAGWF